MIPRRGLLSRARESNTVSAPQALACGLLSRGKLTISESRAVRAQLDWLTLTPTNSASPTLRRYERLRHSRFGRWRFTRELRAKMPYLGLLRAECAELRPGLCRALLPMRSALQSDTGALDSVAVGALCQFAATIVLAASAPPSVNSSVRGLTIELLGETCGELQASARLDRTEWAYVDHIAVPVSAFDAAGQEVARAVVSFALSSRT